MHRFDSTQKGHMLSQIEAQWAEPVSLTFHSAVRKFNRAFHRKLEIDQSETRIACGDHVC